MKHYQICNYRRRNGAEYHLAAQLKRKDPKLQLAIIAAFLKSTTINLLGNSGRSWNFDFLKKLERNEGRIIFQRMSNWIKDKATALIQLKMKFATASSGSFNLRLFGFHYRV